MTASAASRLLLQEPIVDDARPWDDARTLALLAKLNKCKAPQGCVYLAEGGKVTCIWCGEELV